MTFSEAPERLNAEKERCTVLPLLAAAARGLCACERRGIEIRSSDEVVPLELKGVFCVRILIVGASGTIGRAIVVALASSHEIVGVSRRTAGGLAAALP